MDFQEVLNKRRSVRSFSQKSVDRDLIKELVKAAKQAPASCNLQVTQYIIVDNPDLLKKLSQEVSYKFNYSPCAILVLYDRRFTIKRHSLIMGTGMAVENMLLKAVDLGLGTCPMAGFDKDEVIKKILHIPNYMEIALLVAVGYPADSVDLWPIPKIGLEQTYSLNDYSDLKTISSSDNLDKHTVASIIDYRQRIAPVYLSGFRLNTYKDKYYEQLVYFLQDKIWPSLKVRNVLDIMSYDGEFLKLFYAKGLAKGLEVAASDYLVNNLNYFAKEFSCKTYLIDSNNAFVDLDNESVDLMTFIFQLNFTPEPTKLVEAMSQKLKSGAHIFVATIEESWYKKCIKNLFKSYRQYILGEEYNIYENNPFYKIGPIKKIGSNQAKNIFSQVGLHLVKQGLVVNHKAAGIKISFYLFRKG